MSRQERYAFDGARAMEADDALLLREFTHRTGNEIAVAVAAVRLCARPKSRENSRLVEDVVGRLEAFGALNRLLARPVPARTDVAGELSSLCRLMASTSPAAAGSVVTLDLPETWIDGATARRLVLVAAELVGNATKHALAGRNGRLRVSLDMIADELMLLVQDDGPGIRKGGPTSGTGYGTGIVAELVERSGGRIAVTTGPGGTVVRVVMPLADCVDDDPPPF